MRHEINGVIEKDGERYDYFAIIFTDEVNYRPDRIEDITDNDSAAVAEDLWRELEEPCLDDANERVRYAGTPEPVRDDETIEEYLVRTNKARK